MVCKIIRALSAIHEWERLKSIGDMGLSQNGQVWKGQSQNWNSNLLLLPTDLYPHVAVKGGVIVTFLCQLYWAK